MLSYNSSTCRVDQLLKMSIAEITKDYPRRVHRILGEFLRHLRENAPGHQEEIRLSVIVQVHDAGAPSHEARLHPEASGSRDVVKRALAIVAIEYTGVIGEVGLEDIQV